MNKNVIIGILIVLVLLIGGALVYYNGGSQTATSTPTGVTVTPTPTPTPTSQAGVPVVSTNSSVLVSNSTAFVTGHVTPNGSQTSYWYEYGPTTGLGTRTPAQAIGSGFITTPAPAYITGLAANTQYYARLSAQNGFGTVSGNVISFTTNSNPPPSGNAPTTKTDAATQISRTTANLNGHLTPNGSATSYWFEYGETTDLGSATALQAGGDGNASITASLSLSSLKPQTKYYFRLNAQNQYGTVNGSILSFTTSGPPAPTAPTASTDAATSVASASATFHAHVNPNGDQTTYWFEYGVDSLLGSIVGQTTKTQIAGSGTANVAVMANVASLHSSTKYYYRVVAQNSYGTTNGDIVTVTTKGQ